MTKHFTITAPENDQRLDVYLTAKLGLTRNQVRKMILNQQVQINGQRPSVHEFLVCDDVISVNDAAPEPQPAAEPAWPAAAPPKLRPKVIAEHSEYLILDKPSGLLVHPTLKHETNTMVDWLLKNYPKLKKIGENPARPAIVHRLDKLVSGLMIVPKTQNAFDYYKTQFKLHKIKKTYLALVYGRVERPEGVIEFPLARAKSGRVAALPMGSDNGKKAITEFEIFKRMPQYTLLKVRPITGRTNQIRAHLAAYGHPIVGDPLYADKEQNRKSGFTRIFLHAAKLQFADQQGVMQKYESLLPRELRLEDRD